MKLLFKIAGASALLFLLTGMAVLQNWISSSAAAYLVFFVAFAAFATWIFFSVFSTGSPQNANLIACPKCSMRTDSQREECMWCDQGLPES